MGLVEENFTNTGNINNLDYTNGVDWGEILRSERPNPRTAPDKEPAPFINPAGEGKLILSMEPGGRQNCDEPLNLDFKDFFTFTSMGGWSTITLPNDSEQRYYGFDARKSKGYILVCQMRVS